MWRTAPRSVDLTKATSISFQNIFIPEHRECPQRVQNLVSLQITSPLAPGEWTPVGMEDGLDRHTGVEQFLGRDADGVVSTDSERHRRLGGHMDASPSGSPWRTPWYLPQSLSFVVV